MATQIAQMQDLSFLIGNWHSSGKVLATGNDPAVIIHGTDIYEWVSAGAFILHRVDVMMGDENARSVEIIGYDAALASYKFQSYDSEGNISEMYATINNNGGLITEGNNMRSTLTVDDDKHMTAIWERSDGGKNWQRWMDMQFVK
jgi:hypothetical protein